MTFQSGNFSHSSKIFFICDISISGEILFLIFSSYVTSHCGEVFTFLKKFSHVTSPCWEIFIIVKNFPLCDISLWDFLIVLNNFPNIGPSSFSLYYFRDNEAMEVDFVNDDYKNRARMKKSLLIVTTITRTRISTKLQSNQREILVMLVRKSLIPKRKTHPKNEEEFSDAEEKLSQVAEVEEDDKGGDDEDNDDDDGKDYRCDDEVESCVAEENGNEFSGDKEEQQQEERGS